MVKSWSGGVEKETKGGQRGNQCKDGESEVKVACGCGVDPSFTAHAPLVTWGGSVFAVVDAASGTGPFRPPKDLDFQGPSDPHFQIDTRHSESFFDGSLVVLESVGQCLT